MPKFQVVSPHLLSECERVFEEMYVRDPKFLGEAWIGCHAGDHTAYIVVEASGIEEARNKLPEFLRSRTRVVEVEHPNMDQISDEFEAHNRAIP